MSKAVASYSGHRNGEEALSTVKDHGIVQQCECMLEICVHNAIRAMPATQIGTVETNVQAEQYCRLRSHESTNLACCFMVKQTIQIQPNTLATAINVAVEVRIHTLLLP